MADVITFVPSKRGGRLMLLNGHLLSINYNKNDKIYWKCRQAGCKFTAITEGDQLQRQRGEHSHPCDVSLPGMKILRHRVKDLVQEQPLKPVRQVFGEVFADVNLADEREVDRLPSFTSIKNSLYHSRSNRLPPIPHTRADLQLEGEWTQTQDGREFVLANDGIADRLVIFGTIQNLRLLCRAPTIFMDGTFKMALEMFSQIYSMHILHLRKMIPVIVALLPSKTQGTYNRLFEFLATVANRYGMVFQPPTICIDFELAVIKAINEFFPNIRIRGCIIHYTQAMWRKVQDLGLTLRYTEDEAFNRMVRRAAALPLVPPNQVDEVWMRAMNEVEDDAANRFKDYVTTTWVDELVARFPIELWNQYDNIVGIRTINHLEGWHSAINRVLGRPHPNIFSLIEVLKAEQRRTEVELRLIEAGGVPPLQRAANRRINERLLRLQQMLVRGEVDVYQYAGSVAGTLKLN